MENEIGGMVGMLTGIVPLVIALILVVANWKVFTKANQPGWACIIPIYNIYVLTQIIGRPAWWILLLFIPIVNLIVLIIMFVDLAKSFGKGAGYGVGLVFLGFIFMPMLAFGDATYQGPAGAS